MRYKPPADNYRIRLPDFTKDKKILTVMKLENQDSDYVEKYIGKNSLVISNSIFFDLRISFLSIYKFINPNKPTPKSVPVDFVEAKKFTNHGFYDSNPRTAYVTGIDDVLVSRHVALIPEKLAKDEGLSENQEIILRVPNPRKNLAKYF